jgi:hypothetical protein
MDIPSRRANGAINARFADSISGKWNNFAVP